MNMLPILSLFHQSRYLSRNKVQSASTDQFLDLYSEQKNLYLLQLTQPTGLYIAYAPSILTSSIAQKSLKQGVDLSKYINDYICVLQHNSVKINPQHATVLQIHSVIPNILCDDIINKAEEYASLNGGLDST